MPSISLNKETIAFAMGLIGLITAAISGYNWLLSGRVENSPVTKEIVLQISNARTEQQLKDQQQDTRLDRTDRDRDRNTQALKEQTSETQKLKEAVVKLTTVIEQNAVTKKAEYDPLLIPRQPISVEVQ